jgi:FkbM family methyltransferase|tara:strand:+ start:1316 stop:2200 length:885 start_codon:yes stop_codon:yes gene_type:complete
MNKFRYYTDFLKKKFIEREINRIAKKYIKNNYKRIATISYDGISNYTNIYGFYEKEIIITLKKIFKINKINNLFIDVGANYGTYSLYLYNNFKKVISIEATPKLYTLLKYNCEDYKNITTINCAASNNKISKPFYVNNKNFGANSLIKDKYNTKIKVRCNTLDGLIKFNSINNSYVKIDTEGSELLVLKGMKKLLKSKNLIISIEQLEKEFFVKENILTTNCIEFLKKNKFEYFYEITYEEWKFKYIFLSKIFKLLEIIFFIKPYTQIKFNLIKKFEKKIYQQIVCSKSILKSI